MFWVFLWKFYITAQMHLLSTFCQEQAGHALLFNFITPFGMKLHLCFRLLRPDRENFMAGVGEYSQMQTRPKTECKSEYHLNAMQAESVMG